MFGNPTNMIQLNNKFILFCGIWDMRYDTWKGTHYKPSLRRTKGQYPCVDVFSFFSRARKTREWKWKREYSRRLLRWWWWWSSAGTFQKSSHSSLQLVDIDIHSSWLWLWEKGSQAGGIRNLGRGGTTSCTFLHNSDIHVFM